MLSPGVSVTVTDESFYFPVTATTVPLIFIATEYGKTQPNGIVPAQGTLEHSVVRTVTSLTQSLQLYGIPKFREDASGQPLHGDARNEYGLLALNNALGALNRAYVVRANIDLADASETFMSLGVPVIGDAPQLSPGAAGNGIITGVTATNDVVRPQTIKVKFTTPTTFAVSGTFNDHIGAGQVGRKFNSNIVNFLVQSGTAPFVVGDEFTFELVYKGKPSATNVGNGEMLHVKPESLGIPETFEIIFSDYYQYNVVGSITGPMGSGVINSPFSTSRISFTVYPGDVQFAAGDTFTIEMSEVTVTDPLGASDAERRVAITTALQAEINSNTEVRSDIYEYNLILCPGYYECVDEMIRLATDVREEAFVIADTPITKNPDQVAIWANTSQRKNSNGCAYYYPWPLMSNMDGKNVMGAPSGVALRTFAYSDNASYVWFAPAGANRGVVQGVESFGYITGEVGKATTYVEVNLNDGQCDNLYEHYKNINPFKFFPGRGYLVWGQKTSSPVASALDRINVSRLIMYIRRVLRKGAVPFIFEPNDETTRANLKAAADGLLGDILTKRGLYDFLTKCDESNNDPTRIDRNELYLDVALKPVKAAEFIIIPIRVVNTGAELM